jgi:hypothetical protein
MSGLGWVEPPGGPRYLSSGGGVYGCLEPVGAAAYQSSLDHRCRGVFVGGVFLILTAAGLLFAQALYSNLPGPYWRGWPLCQWTAGFLAAAGAAVTVANPSHNALGTILPTALCVIPLTRFANGQPEAAVHAGRDLQQL